MAATGILSFEPVSHLHPLPLVLRRGYSPAVIGDCPRFLVFVGDGMDSGTKPLTLPLVHGVKDVQDLITSHGEGAAVQVAGDAEVQPDVEGVTGGDQTFFHF